MYLQDTFQNGLMVAEISSTFLKRNKMILFFRLLSTILIILIFMFASVVLTFINELIELDVDKRINIFGIFLMISCVWPVLFIRDISSFMTMSAAAAFYFNSNSTTVGEVGL